MNDPTRGGPPPDQVSARDQGTDSLPGRILPPPVSATEWTLDRTRSALSALGDPHLRYPTIHVGGTNGKGSVAAMCAAVLEAAGHRTGLYTSPHLCFFKERFRVGGAPARVAALEAAASEAYDAIDAARLTFFESATVLAMHLFAREGVDIGVIEVGLGGRLDATTVVEPLVTVITNVSLDHLDYLGDSLPQIAAEKAGILKPQVPLVTGVTDPDALAVLRDEAERIGAPLHRVSRDGIARVGVSRGGATFTIAAGPWEGAAVRLPLAGEHQVQNAALALATLERLPPALTPSRDAVVTGFGQVRWPGRMQTVHRDDSLWIFDVAHNEAGARALVRALERIDPPRPVVALVGLQADKDSAAHARHLMRFVDRAILTEPPSVQYDRRWSSTNAVSAWTERGWAAAIPEFRRALAEVQRAARGGTAVVTGSHHTVGDALRALRIPPCEGP